LEKVTEGVAAAAKSLAQDRQDRAMVDDEYARTQYANDMTQDAIYSAAGRIQANKRT
jgi:hypothetical protein